MSVTIRNIDGELNFTHKDWPKLLQLALEYDWEPYGTLPPRLGTLTDPRYKEIDAAYSSQVFEAHRRGESPPLPPDIPEEAYAWEEHPDWDGGYTSNDYQTVTDEDAAHLAAALEWALIDLPDEDLTAPHEVPLPEEVAGLGLRGYPADYDPDPREWFSGPAKALVRQCIAFCKAGGFTIS